MTSVYCSFNVLTHSVSGVETDKAWHREGQKLSSTTKPRLVAHHTSPHVHQILAATASAGCIMTAQAEALAAIGGGGNDTKKFPNSIQNALRKIMSQNPRKNQQQQPPFASPATSSHTNTVLPASKNLFEAEATDKSVVVARVADGKLKPSSKSDSSGKGKSYSQLASLLCEEYLVQRPEAKMEQEEKKENSTSHTISVKPRPLLTPSLPVLAHNDRVRVDKKEDTLPSGESSKVGDQGLPLNRGESRKRPLNVNEVSQPTKKLALDSQVHPMNSPSKTPKQTTPPKKPILPIAPKQPLKDSRAKPSTSVSNKTPPSLPSTAVPPHQQATSSVRISLPTKAMVMSQQLSNIAILQLPSAAPSHQATNLTNSDPSSIVHSTPAVSQSANSILVPPVIPTNPSSPSPPLDAAEPPAPATESLISDLMQDTSDSTMFSLASQLGLTNVTPSLLNLSDFMSIIQPNAGEITSNTALLAAFPSSVEDSVCTPFTPIPPPMTPTLPGTPLLTPTCKLSQPPPLMEISDPPPLTPIHELPPVAVTSELPLLSQMTSRPISLTLPLHEQTSPFADPGLISIKQTATPTGMDISMTTPTGQVFPLTTPSGSEISVTTPTTDYLDLTDIGSLMGSTDDSELLEGIPEDMAKSIKTLMQLDQQTWN